MYLHVQSRVSDSNFILSREKTNLYLSLCDLLSTFALQHTFRSHFFMLTSSISSHVATLLSSKDKHLRIGKPSPYHLRYAQASDLLPRVAALRFFRIHLKNNNRNFLSHLCKLEVFKPIIALTLKESRRDTLVSSSCQEFFEFMRRVRPLFPHLV
jgi:protein phosphatase-4 regulatory subunit 3